MKKRNGFVSNSSSSSFLIYFKRKPTFLKIKEQLFYTERAEVVNSDLDKRLLSIKKDKGIVRETLTLFFDCLVGYTNIRDLDYTRPVTTDYIILKKVFGEIWDDFLIVMNEYDCMQANLRYHIKKDLDRTDLITKLRDKKENIVALLTNHFMNKFSSGYVCALEYSDDEDGVEQDLESSDCLYGLGDCCIRVNKH